ncbi:hypothetical protein DPMN_194372 [Dreissena polymorpha]|uniref:Uncharacterized protein n=1 Tax=Dreissena polymorpha TaxID=45954 RepID=A0A9D3XZG3_DREPO|nr:hypothetical protein DPMN_194372 [Dreissena polymorpha]
MLRRDRTQGKLATALDAETSLELLSTLYRGQPRVIHVIIRFPAVIKTLEDAERLERLAGCHGQSTVIGRVFRYQGKWRVFCGLSLTRTDASSLTHGWKWLAVLKHCFRCGTVADGQTNYKAQPKHNQAKIDQKLPLTTTSTRFSKRFVRD